MTAVSRLILVCLGVTLCESCSWVPKVEQEDFCSAQYVFEADILERVFLSEYQGYSYNIRVKEIFKTNTRPETVRGMATIIGDGPANSCGPQILEENTAYLVYAYTDDGNLRLSEYRKMQFVNKQDITRMTRLYDCSCEIRLNLIKMLTNTENASLSPPTSNQCNIPDNYCSRSFYCKRNPAGICKMGYLGQCY
uniref:Uncharacterized protein LOC111115587 n=1 Tax=Crassostrea virginica TaxID=6565 RepID=A0A8B8C3C0_CRAVI|nr:uncharacterized protein LOC111115587 [Crassostrea virginica]